MWVEALRPSQQFYELHWVSHSNDGVYFIRMTPMQYTAIFLGCKNDIFHLIFFLLFHIFAQNIDCGYTLEPPQ